LRPFHVSKKDEIDDQGYMAGVGFFHDEKDFDSPQRREERRVDGERGSLQFALTSDRL